MFKTFAMSHSCIYAFYRTILYIFALFLSCTHVVAFAQDEPQDDDDGLTTRIEETISAITPVSALYGKSDIATSAKGHGGSVSFIPDLFTGTLTMEVYLDLPQGRAGLQPNINPRYRSSNGNGYMGWGWAFQPDSIGYPSSKDEKQLLYYSKGGNTSLIKTSSSNYRAEIESNFYSFIRVQNNSGNVYWEKRDKKGTIYIYGKSNSSKLVDPNNSTRILRWYLEEVRDLAGNYITYEYLKSDGNPLINKILYTGFHSDEKTLKPPNVIKYLRENQPNQQLEYTFGFPLVLRERISSIIVLSNDEIQRTYTIQYKSDKFLNISTMASITESGSDGLTYSPIEFSYNSSDISFVNDYSIYLSTNPWGDQIRWKSGQIAYPDIDGNGIPDLCVPEFGRISCWINTGNNFKGRFTSPMEGNLSEGRNFEHALLQYPDLNRDGRSDVCGHFHDGVLCWLSNGINFERIVPGPRWNFSFHATAKTLRYPDVNADGFPDICALTESGIECYPGSNDGFLVNENSRINGPAWRQLIVGIGSDNKKNTHWNHPKHLQTIRYLDLNGDGSSDICGRSVTGIECYLTISGQFDLENPIKGPSWSDKIIQETSNTNDKNSKAITDWAQEQYYSTIEFPDLNADSLPDICGRDRNGIICYLNVGGLFNISSSLRGPDWKDVSKPIAQPQNDIIDWSNKERYSSIRYVDINSDSKIDICGRYPQGYMCSISLGDKISHILINGPPVKDTGQSNWSKPELSTSLHFIDIDGNNLVDVCGRTAAGIVCWKNAGDVPLLLSSTKSKIGQITDFDYSTSARTNSRIPFSLNILKSIHTSDGRGNNRSTKYTYTGGYYNVQENQFRGFNHVTVTNPPLDNGESRIDHLWFHQGNGTEPFKSTPEDKTGYLRGKIYLSEIKSSNGRLYKKTTYKYQKDTEAPFFNPPIEVKEFNCEEDNCKQASKITREYDSNTGALLRMTNHGDPNDISDDLSTTWKYINNWDNWILGLPISETTYLGKHDQNILSLTKYGYDESFSCENSIIRNDNHRIPYGWLTSVTRWNDIGQDPVTRMSYDKFGNLNCTKGPGGDFLLTTYDESGTYAILAENSVGHRTYQTFYGVNGEPSDGGLYGQLRSTTDANGAIALDEYDSLGRPIRHVASNGAITKVVYDYFGDPEKQYVKITNPNGEATTVFLDSYGRVYKQLTPGGELGSIIREYKFDSNGNLVAESLPRYKSQAPYFRYSQFDILGRLIKTINPDKTEINRCFGFRKSAVIDEIGRNLLSEYDAYGRLARTLEFNELKNQCSINTNNSTIETIYKRNAFGQVISINDRKGKRLSIHYDSLGKKIKMSDSDMGTWKYSYDIAGNLIHQKSPAGKQVILRRDIIGRVIEKEYSNVNKTNLKKVKYKYDSSNNSLGRLSKVTDSSGTTEFSYTLSGQLEEYVKKINGKEYHLRTEYDKLGRKSTITYPNGEKILYTYDGPFLLSINRGNDMTIATFSEFDALVGAKLVTYGNGIISRTSFSSDRHEDNCGYISMRICSRELLREGLRINFERFKYNLKGNPITIHRPNKTMSLQYDNFNRLIATKSKDSKQKWSYDERDNIINYSGLDYIYADPTKPNFLTQAGKRLFIPDLSGNVSLTYKLNNKGRPIAASKQSIKYDGNNRVSFVEGPDGASISYLYDGDDQLVQRERVSETTHYISPYLECQNNECANKIFAGNQLLAIIPISTGRIYFRHSDYAGSTTEITDQEGIIVGKFQYSPYGKQLNENNIVYLDKIRFEYLYLGKLQEQSLHYYRLGERLYDPSIGRFLQPDALLSSPQLLRASNRYTYAFNNPYTYVDPNGNLGIGAVILVGALIGGTANALLSDDPFLEAFLKGAAIGAITAGVGYGAGQMAIKMGATTFGSAVIGGSAVGGVNAAISGNDIGQGMLYGAIGSAVTYGMGSVTASSAAKSGGEAIIRQVTRDALKGATRGFVLSAIRGQDPAQGAILGARNGVLWGQVNNAIGIAVGIGYSGQFSLGKFHKGAFFYRAESSMAGPGVTFGLFATIDPAPYDAAIEQYLVFSPDYIKASNALVLHEVGHVYQYEQLGGHFLPAYGASLLTNWASGAKYPLINNAFENSMPAGTLTSDQLNNQHGHNF